METQYWVKALIIFELLEIFGVQAQNWATDLWHYKPRYSCHSYSEKCIKCLLQNYTDQSMPGFIHQMVKSKTETKRFQYKMETKDKMQTPSHKHLDISPKKKVTIQVSGLSCITTIPTSTKMEVNSFHWLKSWSWQSSIFSGNDERVMPKLNYGDCRMVIWKKPAIKMTALQGSNPSMFLLQKPANISEIHCNFLICSQCLWA